MRGIRSYLFVAAFMAIGCSSKTYCDDCRELAAVEANGGKTEYGYPSLDTLKQRHDKAAETRIATASGVPDDYKVKCDCYCHQFVKDRLK